METTYLPREISRSVAEALESLPVVVITGVRQAGKTTFLLRDPLFRGRRYLSLDDFPTLEAAKRDPDALLRSEDPLGLDEVQRCPELLLALQRAVDRDRRPGRYVLTGSANLAWRASRATAPSNPRRSSSAACPRSLSARRLGPDCGSADTSRPTSKGISVTSHRWRTSLRSAG